MMKIFVFLFVVVFLVLQTKGNPIHSHETSNLHSKEAIKAKLTDAAVKSSTAMKAKGVAILAVAKAPFHLAKDAANHVGLKAKKVAAGLVAKKAILVSKVSAIAAAAKAATAAKAAVVAKTAFGIKLKTKAKIAANKHSHHKHNKHSILPFEKKKKEISSFKAIRKPIEAIKHQITTAAKAVIAKQSLNNIQDTEGSHSKFVLNKNDPLVAKVVSRY